METENKEQENKEIDFKSIEEKWQKAWDENKVFQVKKDDNKEKQYTLVMFPYPSGSGLHMGHTLNFVIGDIFARTRRMQGYNVLHPMGYDSLGLPAENAAIKAGENPKKYTEKCVESYTKQMKKLGLSYDWSRMVATHWPEYYKWDQWIFLKMFEKGLVYRGEAPVNWCPSCKTVLANEQAQGGVCDRCGSEVKIKHLKQWFLKITEYADELYNNDDLDWPKRTKAMQKNWIGKSYGTEIEFPVEYPESNENKNDNKENWKIFTTRPDTIFGVTFMVVSAQHKNLMKLVSEKQKPEVEEFLKKIKSVSEKDTAEDDALQKEGVFTGSYAINPMTNEKIPIYTGNFVLAEYGSGMVMAVPAHDQRDYEFAKKYGIEIKQVIKPEENNQDKNKAYTGGGALINSGDFNNLDSNEAKKKITEYLQEQNLGEATVNYKLRDWLISRQRYWGTPIPIVHCEKCGEVPVPEENLPVELPDKVSFQEGGNPLETNKDWINTTCPKCSREAVRETDTMDTFVNSSWYFLRYTDPQNKKEIFDKSKGNYWCPVDTYIGGAEHACMHLIYSRFYTKFLRDIGLVNFDEPAKKLFHQGMLLGPDGEKMSKSRGNVVLPDTVSEKYGIDTARTFIVSSARPDRDIQWDPKDIKGTLRFIKGIFSFTEKSDFNKNKDKKSTKIIAHKVNKAVKEINRDLENFDYNLAIIKLRKLYESFS
ncbi:MAG TPA: leucine--tRNA ligase, partial [Candidatus Nanoarchaeia archaeon]|nr:leucine--tRNA ligase [Candidatus Nanoarchaeia archaeon]